MSKTITAIVDDNIFERFDKICGEKGTSKLKMVNRLVENYTKEHNRRKSENGDSGKVINLRGLRPEIWEAFDKKTKSNADRKRRIVALLIYDWIRNDKNRDSS